MVRWAAAVTAAVLCIAGLVVCGGNAAGPAAEKTAAGETMYHTEQVLGLLMSASRMYAAQEVEWYEGSVRVDAVESQGSALKVGEVLRVRYQVDRKAPGVQRPGHGDVIRATLRQEEDGTGSFWRAEGFAVLGRAELLNPGQGAEVDVGSPQAKVLVKMFAPLAPECHRKTADLLKELAAREPERMRLQIFNMTKPQTRQEMQRERLQCASVLVNNRLGFMIQGPAGPRRVVFSHQPNEPHSSYNSEDVVTVVEQEIKRLYPE